MTAEAKGDQLAAAIGSAASHKLQEALDKIKHCLNQLDDQQIWWRPDEAQNSIANLILHLCGNLRQWAISGLGGARDMRNRPLEFSQRDAIPKNELLKQLETAVGEAKAVFAKMTADELLRVRRIQGFDVSGVAAIFSTVPHFRGHSQEIICRTRFLVGERYQFLWKPKTAQQGAQA